MCHQIIDMEAKSYNGETKMFQEILMTKMQSVKQKISIFYLPFYSFLLTIDGYCYLLLPDKI